MSQKQIEEDKINTTKLFLTRVYNETYEGYKSIGLSSLGERFGIDKTFVCKALLNLKIIDFRGKLKSVKYLWISKELPNFKMAHNVLQEIKRLKLNQRIRINEDKKAKKLIAEKISIKNKVLTTTKKEVKTTRANDVKTTLYDKYYVLLTNFVNKYKEQEFEKSMSQALIDFKIPPYFGVVLYGNDLIENKKIVKNASIDAILYFASKYNNNSYYKHELKLKRQNKVTNNPKVTAKQKSNPVYYNDTLIDMEQKNTQPVIDVEQIIDLQQKNTEPIINGISLDILINKRNDLYSKSGEILNEISNVESAIEAYKTLEKYFQK